MTFDTHLPAPPPKRHRWVGMEVGESLFIPGLRITSVQSSLAYAKWKLGFGFTSRTVVEDGVGGVRVWRVE
jgi:hypothetical protein